MSTAPASTSGKRAYTIREFGSVFSIGRSKTYELILSGDLQVVKAGSKSLITSESAEAWWASLPKLNTKPGGPDT